MPPILSSFGGLSAIGRGQRAGGRKVVQITLASTQNNYVLNTAKVSEYEVGNTDVELIINSGVVVGSASTGSFSFDVDASWHAHDTIRVVNNGIISACGGAGGQGGVGVNNYGGRPGAAGGPALRAQRPISIANNGIIRGGGGGGGGGSYSVCGYGATTLGGAGGAGASNAAAATAGDTGSVNGCPALPGGPGGAFASYGGSGTDTYGDCEAGSCWREPEHPPGSGGAPGACTSGNANITWLATGTRLGALN